MGANANECEPSRHDSDVLLPPRKRLLAGLKRQSSEGTLQSSPESASPTTPLSEFNTQLNNLLKSHQNGASMSPEEIAKAAGSAATAATKAAEAARAVAEEKAAIAAKAVAAAKNALDLVASFSDDSERHLNHHQKKNKMKKQVPVQLLYRKDETVDNRGSDEELARKLHRAINSSPRISKHSPPSESKGKHKKPKITYEDGGVFHSVEGGNRKSASPGGDQGTVRGNMGCEGSFDESSVVKGYEKGSRSHIVNLVEGDDNVDAESSHSKGKFLESADDVRGSGRKRGRIKQKKLPLSFCSFKDQANPREEMNQRSLVLDRATHREKPSNSNILTASS